MNQSILLKCTKKASQLVNHVVKKIAIEERLASIPSYFSWMFTPFTPASGQVLQVTTTYFHPWIHSYKRYPFMIFFRFLFAIVITIFIIIDNKRDRTHDYLYSKANEVPWPLEPFNWIYVGLCVTYWVQIGFFFTRNKVDFSSDSFTYKDDQHFEPFPPNFPYWSSIMISVLPPMALAHLTMFFETRNFHTNIFQWEQISLVVLTNFIVVLDTVVISNYFMDFNHLHIGFGLVGLILGVTNFYWAMGLVVYPIFDLSPHTRRGAISSTIFLNGLYGFYFMVLFTIALLKQEFHDFQRTALWFRRDPYTKGTQQLDDLTSIQVDLDCIDRGGICV